VFPTLIEAIDTKKERHNIYQNGFHVAGGVVTSLIINELWENFKLPGYDNKPITESLITKQPLYNSNISTDMLWKLAVSSIVMLSELVGVKGGFLLGMFVGFSWTDKANTGKYIGNT
jgi:hypothetical protein